MHVDEHARGLCENICIEVVCVARVLRVLRVTYVSPCLQKMYMYICTGWDEFDYDSTKPNAVRWTIKVIHSFKPDSRTFNGRSVVPGPV